MNYIELVNRFWLIDLEANFSHLEVHLFFKLLDLNNRLGWKEGFKFPNSRLEAEIGSRQKNLIQARQRLDNFNVIEYKKGTTRDAGIYKLLSNTHTKESNQESKNGCNHGCNTEVIRGTLNKLNKTKLKEEIPPNPQGGKSEVSNPETLIPEKEEKSENEKEFERFNKWIDENAPYIRKIKNQITMDEYFRITKLYNGEQIRDTLLAISNYKDAPKKYTSVNLTFQKWAKKEYGTQ